MTVSDGMIEEAARRFALLADPTRLRILSALLERGEGSVTELAEAIGAAPPNVSQHLSRLLAAGMVGRRRNGHSVHYTIADETLRPLCDLVCSALEGRSERRERATAPASSRRTG
jgi:DNA-binding transcriptional ArsR family regulator